MSISPPNISHFTDGATLVAEPVGFDVSLSTQKPMDYIRSLSEKYRLTSGDEIVETSISRGSDGQPSSIRIYSHPDTPFYEDEKTLMDSVLSYQRKESGETTVGFGNYDGNGVKVRYGMTQNKDGSVKYTKSGAEITKEEFNDALGTSRLNIEFPDYMERIQQIQAEAGLQSKNEAKTKAQKTESANSSSIEPGIKAELYVNIKSDHGKVTVQLDAVHDNPAISETPVPYQANGTNNQIYKNIHILTHDSVSDFNRVVGENPVLESISPEKRDEIRRLAGSMPTMFHVEINYPLASTPTVTAYNAHSAPPRR